jgi:hypothetical protein
MAAPAAKSAWLVREAKEVMEVTEVSFRLGRCSRGRPAIAGLIE